MTGRRRHRWSDKIVKGPALSIRICVRMKPLVLDLFCGEGGAAMGLHLAGFDVIGSHEGLEPAKLGQAGNTGQIICAEQHRRMARGDANAVGKPGRHPQGHPARLFGIHRPCCPTIYAENRRMIDLPVLALSVRQPWAWAIIHAGKDVENRSWQAVNHGLRQRGRIAIHAAKGMTREEYYEANEWMNDSGFKCPDAIDLLRGGIIGSVEVIDVVSGSDSPWFFGPRGLVLRDPVPYEFIPCIGALGYFEWRKGAVGQVSLVKPAKWMLPKDSGAGNEVICAGERQESFL